MDNDRSDKPDGAADHQAGPASGPMTSEGAAAKPTPEKPVAGQDKLPDSMDKLPAGADKASADAAKAPAAVKPPDDARPAPPPGSEDDTVRSMPSPVAAEAANAQAAPRPGPGPLIGTELIGGQAGAAGHQLDRRATFRRWLEAKTKEELVELIMTMEQEQPALEVTEKMMKVKLIGPMPAPIDSFKIPDDLPYLRLPVVRTSPPNEPTPTWRIVLVSLEQNNKPVGLIVDGEITIGRTAGGSTPDLDLTPFGAALKGVSRIHARLRPTMHSLTLMDNNSSNGTYCNRSRIAPDSEQPLKEGDVIAFGQAYFLVRVVKSPDAGEAKTLI